MFSYYGFVGRDYLNKSLGMSVRCVKDISEAPNLYNLQLEAHPEEAGIVTGAGQYQEGDAVLITATVNPGWEFVNWTGDIAYVNNPALADAIVTMPAQDISLTANFQEEDSDIIYGDGVTDVNGNYYVTVIIGTQEWMAENLRVTRYPNGINIPTGLSASEWEGTTEPAYAIYPHTSIDGLNSDEDVLQAYGALYNWYAVDDETGLCPEGWSVPSDDDWTALVNYVVSEGFPNSNITNGAGNALKSCRQVDHPDGGHCDTSEHPRWDSHGTHSGFYEFGCSALPGGGRYSHGVYYNIGSNGYWWSSSEDSSTNAWHRYMGRSFGGVNRHLVNKHYGYSVRCFRDIDN